MTPTPVKNLLPALLAIAISLAAGIGCSKQSLQQELVQSFQNLDEFVAMVGRGTAPKVYEGLPHNYWEPEQYASERKSKPTVTIQGYDFYETPVSTTPTEVKQLQGLLTSKTSFVAFRGGKACGGFHPDWCLTWSDGTSAYTVFLCFGCGEMEVFKDGQRLILCDIEDKSQFESLLNPLHVNRPKRQVRTDID